MRVAADIWTGEVSVCATMGNYCIATLRKARFSYWHDMQ